EPPARASAMARQSPGSALSQEQWNRRPVSQRGETPKLEQEWRATDNPNHEIAPGGMRSDREEVPAGFSKANADKAETMEAALAGGDSEMRTLAAPDCQVYWPAPYEVCGEIRDKYNALGGPNSFLLFPKTNELTNPDGIGIGELVDRKSTRLNSSHVSISYAVFCLKKKIITKIAYIIL